MKSAFRPDGFAIGLFVFGLILLFVPLMVMPGLIAMVSALAYWLTIFVVRKFKNPRI